MRDVIKIDDNGRVVVPNGNVLMTDFEIANLLEVMVPTVKGKIKTLLKSRQFRNCSNDGVINANGSITPDYYGLDMVVAIAFQVDSYKADIFRRWLMRRLIANDAQPIYIGFNEIRGSIFC